MVSTRICIALIICTMPVAGADGALDMTARFSAGDGRQMAVFSDGAKSIVGKLNGPCAIDGAALVLNGRAQAVFPYSGLADAASGELSFRVKLNFDPETDPRAKGDLKNQFFFSIVQGKKQFIIYTYFVNLSFLVQDENGKIEIVKTIPTSWVKDEWRTVKLRWGREIELFIDTDRIAADGKGLFSPRADGPPPEIIIGSQSIVSGIASAFTVDSLYIRRTPLASHERERFENHFRTSRQLIGYPAYPLSASDRSSLTNSADVRRNYRMRSWAFPTNVSADDAGSMVRLVKEQGFNVLLSEGNRNLFIDRPEQVTGTFFTCKGPAYSDLIRNSRLVSDACHRNGMKFYVHLTATMVNKNVIDEHPEWSVIDMTNGAPFINQYGTYTVCFNNDEFFGEYIRRLERYLRECNADGLMMDEIQYFSQTTCGCRSCARKFRSETGFDVPALDKITGLAMRDPATRAWFEWRAKKLQQGMIATRNALKRVNPNALEAHYLCNNSTGWAYAAAGFNMNLFDTFVDSVGYEVEPPNYLYGYYWPLMMTEIKYMRSVAEKIDNNMWAYFYPKKPGDFTWNWFVALSQGVRSWWSAHSASMGPELWQPLVSWEEKHEAILSGYTSTADIALVYPRRTRDLVRAQNCLRPDMQGFSAVSMALIDSHVPYAVVQEEDLARPDVTGKYKTIMLVNAASLTEKEADGIRGFVKSGGVLVATGDASLHDGVGDKRSDFQLADLYGASYDGEDARRCRMDIVSGAFTEVPASLMHRDRSIRLKNMQPAVTVIGSFVIGEASKPALLVNHVGKGKVIYCAGHPESGYFYSYHGREVINPGRFWKDNRDPGYRALWKALALSGGTGPLVADNLPRGVTADVYDHRSGGMKGRIVHLANFTGGAISEGVVPLKNDISYPLPVLPDPSKPVRIQVRSEVSPRCFVFSPDFDGVAELAVQYDGTYASVEFRELARYLILYFSTGDIAEIKKMSGGVKFSAIPAAKELVYKSHEPLCGAFDPRAQYVFADAEQCRGGKFFEAYQEECGRFLYGDRSGTSGMTADFSYAGGPRAILEIGGIDDNAATHAPIVISLNGTVILSGENPFPDNSWAVKQFALPDGIVRQGNNVLSISNTGKGGGGSSPWFGFNYLKILEK